MHVWVFGVCMCDVCVIGMQYVFDVYMRSTYVQVFVFGICVCGECIVGVQYVFDVCVCVCVVGT